MSARAGSQGTWRERLVDAYLTSIPLIWANVVWVLLSLPLVTLFPALAGLYYSTQLIAGDRDGGGRAVWEGFRAYFWPGWRWGLFVGAGVVLCGANVWFYGRVETEWAWLPRAFFFMLLVLWLAANVYTFPLLLQQKELRLRTALRNSLVLWLKRPFHSLLLIFACALLGWASTVYFPLAWVFLTGALCTYLANRTVLETVAASKLPAEDEPG